MNIQTLSFFDALDTHFRKANPIFKLRGELLKLKLNGNELCSAYKARLKEHSEECDLHNIMHKDVILLITTMHCNRGELCKDIKQYVNPSWLAVEQLAENYERSVINEEPHEAGKLKKSASKKKKKQGKMPKYLHMKGK